MSEKSNDHRKLYKPDYFGWHLYCTHARIGTKRMDKHNAKKAVRRHRKASCKQQEEEYEREIEKGL